MDISLGYNESDPISLSIVQLRINDFILEGSGGFSGESIDLTDWWIPDLPIVLSIKYRVDEKQVREDCALWANDKVFGFISAYCPHTKIQYSAEPKLIGGGVNELSMEIPEFCLSGTFRIKLELFVDFDKDTERKFGSPKLPFSRLMSREALFSLSGSDSMAQVQVSDFNLTANQRGSIWKIKFDLPTELEEWDELQISNVVLIELNSEVDEAYFQDEVFLTLLATELIALALDQFFQHEERLDLLYGYSTLSGSWIEFAHTYFRRLFPPHELSVRANWLQNQSFFRTRIQHMVSRGIREQIATVTNGGA